MYLQTITKNDKNFLSRLEMIVTEHTNMPMDLIKGPSRKAEIVIVRFIVAYMLKKYTLMSLQTIGSYLSGRDHSTIINSLRVVSEWFDQPKMYGAEIKLLLTIEEDLKNENN